MKVTQQALAIARIQTGQGPVEEKAKVMAWDRLNGLLSTLDSKTSVLLRFNAIVVAALAYVLIISASEPFMGTNPTVKLVGTLIGHASLLVSVVSCGFAFPVINVQWDFFGMRLDRPTDTESPFDDAALARMGAPRRLSHAPLFLGVAAGRRRRHRLCDPCRYRHAALTWNA
jgi:hypothetical protein